MKSLILSVVSIAVLTLAGCNFLTGEDVQVTPEQLASLESKVAVVQGVVDIQRATVNVALSQANIAKAEADRLAAAAAADASKADAAATARLAADNMAKAAAKQVSVLNASESTLAQAQALVEQAKTTGVVSPGMVAADSGIAIGSAMGGPTGSIIAALGAGLGIYQTVKRRKGATKLETVSNALVDIMNTIRYVDETPNQAARTDVVKAVADNLDDHNAKTLLVDGVLWDGSKLPAATPAKP